MLWVDGGRSFLSFDFLCACNVAWERSFRIWDLVSRSRVSGEMPVGNDGDDADVGMGGIWGM